MAGATIPTGVEITIDISMSAPAVVAMFAIVAGLFGAGFILAAAYMGQKASRGG